MYVIKILFISIASLIPLQGMKVDENNKCEFTILEEYKRKQLQYRDLPNQYYEKGLISGTKEKKILQKY